MDNCKQSQPVKHRNQQATFVTYLVTYMPHVQITYGYF